MRNAPEAVMLFAAGFGTRMKHLTKDRPKPMIEVAGKPLVDHTLEIVDDFSPKIIAANLHYKPQVLRDHLAGRDIALIEETPDILETGGGLRNALPVLGDGPVFTMNTDAIWNGPNPLKLLRDAWDGDRMDALLMLVDPATAVGYSGTGDFRKDANGRLNRGSGLVYGGVQIMTTDRLKSVSDKAFSLNIVWDQMLADQRLFGVPYPGSWCDVGHPGGIALAEGMIADV